MLGQLLSEARQRRNVTMDEVGAAVGVTPSCVARWETSRETMPNSRHLWRLCEFLQLDAVLLVRACDPSGEGVRDD
jgi:transcriptional regulator with XRE-family HTH domain